MAELLLIIIFFNLCLKGVFGEYNGKDFISYVGRRVKEPSNDKHLTGVSQIECLSSCFSSGKCCAVSYSPNNSTCLIDVADMCCHEPVNDSKWNLWTKSKSPKRNLPDNSTVHRPIDCGDVDGESGVYTIYGASQNGLEVLCDMDTDCGGWTVFQRRMNGEIDFYLGWPEYENSFGNLSTEFWIGNKHLYAMTSQHSYALRIDLEDFDNRTRYAQYGTFYIGDSNDKYKLTVDAYSGDAGDSVTYSNGMSFTTKDQENDLNSYNCAVEYKGAWWYKACQLSNLNGLYLGGPNTSYADGIVWWTWTGHYYSLKSVKMMIRRQSP